MKNNLETNSYLFQEIIKFIRLNGFENLLIKEIEEPEYIAFYENRLNTLFVNVQSLIEEAELNEIKLKDYITIMICHELGHVSDPQLPTIEEANRKLICNIEKYGYDDVIGNEIINNRIKVEYNAWELGLKFVPDELVEMYKMKMVLGVENSLHIFKMENEQLKFLMMQQDR
jgi:hypothetical protein